MPVATAENAYEGRIIVKYHYVWLVWSIAFHDLPAVGVVVEQVSGRRFHVARRRPGAYARDMIARFGKQYRDYVKTVPAFFPRLRRAAFAQPRHP